MKSEIRLTEDGSHTLYVKEIDESYHSSHGAVQESSQIFITNGLKAFVAAYRQVIGDDSRKETVVKVLEIGFGTGLNAYLTLLEATRMKIPVHYTSLELYPLVLEEAFLLNYPEILCADRELFEAIHLISWDEMQPVSTYFSLQKIKADFTDYMLQDFYDVVFFDAFSPEKQPEMWAEKGFCDLFDHCNENAIITSYCAKGAVRRMMQSAGFVVERLPGPPGKREVLRGKRVHIPLNGCVVRSMTFAN